MRQVIDPCLWRPLLILCAGATLPLAFAPWNAWWFAPWPLAVLFALAGRTRSAVLRDGYLFGLGMFGTGIFWVHVGLVQFGLGLFPAVLATAALVAVLAIFPAVAMGMAQMLCPQRNLWRFMGVLPGAWVVLEWLRGWLFTGFPWLTLGYSQTAGPFGTRVAPVFGVLGVSLLVAVVAGVLAWVGGGRARYALRGLAFASVLALVPVGYALPWIAWTRPSGQLIHAVLIQGNVAQSQKWRAANLMSTLTRYRRLTAPYWGADLIVWPETAIPELYRALQPTYFRRLARRARQAGTDLIVGVPRLRRGHLYNSAVEVGRHEFYAKHHLVPFGEYLPLRPLLGPVFHFLGLPAPDFTAGSGKTNMTVGSVKAEIAICYEIAFSRQVASRVAGTGLLLNLSDNAWFGDSIGPDQNLQMAQMRAMETQRPVLSATNDGVTAAINAHGRIVSRAPQFEALALPADVAPRTGLTPYVRWADRPLWGFLAFLGAVILWRRRTGSRRVAASMPN